MTLSRFLRDYLYIPLGGNRRGGARRYANLMITMLLGGLWHGAGWTFVVWGGLRALYLVLNRARAGWRQARKGRDAEPTPAGEWAARALTFLAVVVGWVIFRSADFATAGRMLCAMLGTDGIQLRSIFDVGNVMATLALLLFMVWFLPNTQELLAAFAPALGYPGPDAAAKPVGRLMRWLQWRPNAVWAVAMAIVAVITITQMSHVSEFIYWQF